MKNLKYIFPFACLVFITFYSLSAENPILDNENKKISYVIGRQIGQSLKAQNMTDLDIPTLQLAINDFLNNKPSLITEEEANIVMTSFQQKKLEEYKIKGQETKQQGLDFLAKNKDKQGVKVSASGLQYEIIKEGIGDSPKATDKVKVHYEGKLINGEVFDSSIKRGEPVTFPLNGVIAGWTEGLQMMKVGGKSKLYIPSELAYGEQGRPGAILPNSVLIFDIELLEIIK